MRSGGALRRINGLHARGGGKARDREEDRPVPWGDSRAQEPTPVSGDMENWTRGDMRNWTPSE
jgi:hypothetical protein